MLHSTYNNKKTYEDMLNEAIAQIPLYSKEWTNYNESDPGITILQNFAAFHVLQQESIQTITEEGRRNLLKLAGFQTRKNQNSHVLLQIPAAVTGPVRLPAHQRLLLGDTCFETSQPVTLNKQKLIGIYQGEEGNLLDVSYLLNGEVPISTAVFGLPPKVGSGLYLEFCEAPEPDTLISIYVQAEDTGKRNPFARDHRIPFALTEWECLTADGWTALEAADETMCFLQSGRITLHMPSKEMVSSEDSVLKGYVIRCRLVQEEYDIPPSLLLINGNLLEVCQQTTLSASFTFPGPVVSLESRLADDNSFYVYCRETAGGDYRAYRRASPGEEQHGRYYRILSQSPGRLNLIFDQEAYGYGPCEDEEAVRVICYTEETVYSRLLDTVYGYDNQMIGLGGKDGLLGEQFTVLVEWDGEDGQPHYVFQRPGSEQEGEIGYEVLEGRHELCITNPGLGRECRLYLCDYVVTKGAEGNIRAGNQLAAPGRQDGTELPMVFANVMAGTDGVSCESARELADRFAREMDQPFTAVLAADYESLVSAVPGLCIDRVRAVLSEQENLVKIAVKPKTREKYSGLSGIYRREILADLEKRRMISTEIRLVPPCYVPIHVQGKIYVKNRSQDCEQQIRRILKEELDFTVSGAGFGAVIHPGHIFEKIQKLEFVSYIYDLDLISQEEQIEYCGTDIWLGYACLSYLGNVNIEMIL